MDSCLSLRVRALPPSLLKSWSQTSRSNRFRESVAIPRFLLPLHLAGHGPWRSLSAGGGGGYSKAGTRGRRPGGYNFGREQNLCLLEDALSRWERDVTGGRWGC